MADPMMNVEAPSELPPSFGPPPAAAMPLHRSARAKNPVPGTDKMSTVMNRVLTILHLVALRSFIWKRLTSRSRRANAAFNERRPAYRSPLRLARSPYRAAEQMRLWSSAA
jgi:hypothetical protein